jgi:hypothetical protein
MDGLLIPLACLAVIGAALAARAIVRLLWAASELVRPGLGSVARDRRARPSDVDDAMKEAAAAYALGVPAGLAETAPTLPSGPPPKAGEQLLLTPLGVSVLAPRAAAGEQADFALRRLDQTLQALETDGCVVMFEVELGGVLVRRAVVAETGVFVVTARPPRWPASDADLLDDQATALSRALGIEREEVTPVVALEARSGPAHRWCGGAHFSPVVVVGRSELRVWLLSQPRRVDHAVLEQLREAIEVAKQRPAAPMRAGVARGG